MARSLNEGLSGSAFTPHRTDVVADDPAVGDAALVSGLGMASSDYDSIVASVVLSEDTTDANIELLLWSDLAGQFLRVGETPEVVALDSSRVLRFQVHGGRFLLHVSGLAGTDPRVDVEVVGAPR